MTFPVGIPVHNSGSTVPVRGARIAAGIDDAGPLATSPASADQTRRSVVDVGEPTPKGRKPEEALCAPCVYGQHELCLRPIGDAGNCCCDELDGWANRE